MSRPSFRARPIDISQALAIIRDESVLNDESQAVAREVTHAHKNLDKDNEEVRPPRPFPRAPRLPFSHRRSPGHARALSGVDFYPHPSRGSGRVGAHATRFSPFFPRLRILHVSIVLAASRAARSAPDIRADARVSAGVPRWHTPIAERTTRATEGFPPGGIAQFARLRTRTRAVGWPNF